MKTIYLLAALVLLAGIMLVSFFLILSEPEESQLTPEENAGLLELVSPSPDPVPDYSELTPEQKAGRVLVTVPSGLTLTQEEKTWLREGAVGGFFLLGKNIRDEKQVKKLTSAITFEASSSGFKPIIAVDQEGGGVSRISWIETTPQSEIKTSEEAIMIGRKRGAQLEKLGFTMNFSPVVDRSATPSSYIVTQKRTFTANWEEKGIGMATGYLQSGIVPVFKHFPGSLGHSTIDPHRQLPKVFLTETELSADLAPFEVAARYGMPAVMVTHIVVENLDTVPASRSKKIIQELLIQSLWYEGVVVIDDISMDAVAADSASEFSLDSLRAGANLILVSGKDQFEAVRDTVAREIEADPDFEALVNLSLYKIEKMNKL